MEVRREALGGGVSAVRSMTSRGRFGWPDMMPIDGSVFLEIQWLLEKSTAEIRFD